MPNRLAKASLAKPSRHCPTPSSIPFYLPALRERGREGGREREERGRGGEGGREREGEGERGREGERERGREGERERGRESEGAREIGRASCRERV